MGVDDCVLYRCQIYPFQLVRATGSDPRLKDTAC